MTPQRALVLVAAAIGFALLPEGQANAAPPQISGIAPFGAKRGVATEVTVKGSNLESKPRLVAPFGFRVAEPAPAGSDASNARLMLTIDRETPLGVYPVRIRTDDGFSNPFLFAVGQLPQVAEKEENSNFETAQVVTAPVVIEGQAAGNDVDYFKFAGKKGQRVVVDAQCARIGSGIDPTIRLTTAGHAFVASAEDSPGLLTDARLFATLPEDTDYVIELSDSRYQGGGRPIYRLVVGEVPVAEEVYPIGGRAGETVGVELRGGTLDGLKLAAVHNDTAVGARLTRVRAMTAAGLDVESLPSLRIDDLPEVREPADPAVAPVRVAVPVVLNGRIDPAGDEDRFILAVTPGQKLRIVVEAAENGSALDGVLQVLDPKGNQLAQADDTTSAPSPKGANNKVPPTVSPDPSLDFTVPAGLNEVTLSVHDLVSRGGVGFPYRIVVRPSAPGFSATLNESQVSVPRGGTAAVGLTVVRNGYSGPIVLKVINPPAGLSYRPGTIAEGQTLGVFTVTAAADATLDDLATLDVMAESEGAGPSVAVKASKTIVFAKQGALPTNSLAQVGMPAALAQAQPVSLDTPDGPIEVAHGLGVPIPVKIARGKEGDGSLAVSLITPPPGVTVGGGKISEKETEGTVTLNTTTEAPLGLFTVALSAKGKIAGADRTIEAPAVTLNLVKPAAVELATATVEIKPGATIELKGKVVRKGTFKEPVTVKLSKLPAGLSAEPVTLAPDASEYTLKIAADDKAKVTTTEAAVVLGFQVNKKDYNPAPTAALAVKVLPAK